MGLYIRLWSLPSSPVMGGGPGNIREVFPEEDYSNPAVLFCFLQVLGTPTREQIREMNPNYTEFKFPQIKAHPWTKVRAAHHLLLIHILCARNIYPRMYRGRGPPGTLLKSNSNLKLISQLCMLASKLDPYPHYNS